MTWANPFHIFWRDESGAALVEFALLLPTLLLFLGLSIEGARSFWSFQTTLAGVRDASHYVARVAAADICETGGSLTAYEEKLAEIVRNSDDGSALFPSSIQITSVTATLTCVAGGYRGDTVPMALVTARLAIDFPFKGFFRAAGMMLESIETNVSDSSRILGS
jgi:Flp pilus assembly protein TadG